MKVELYYYDQCPFCQMVLRKIQDLKIENKITLKNTLTNPEFAKFHRDTTGRSTVPCIYIDNKPMFESYDICDWLEENKNSITA